VKIPFFFNDEEKDREQKNSLKLIAIDKISPNPYQPRSSFAQEELEELADSIAKHGVIQPLTIRPIDDNNYQLIAGERRLRAAKILEKDKVPAVVREFSDQEMAEVALIENLQRKDLSFFEEATAYQVLLEKFSLTQSELAEAVGKSQSTIANKVRLLQLPLKIREKIAANDLSERQARALLKLKKQDDRERAIDIIVEKELTVRETDKLVNDILAAPEKKKRKGSGQLKAACNDVRLYINSLEQTLDKIKKSGADLAVDKNESDEEIEYVIRFSKKQSPHKEEPKND